MVDIFESLFAADLTKFDNRIEFFEFLISNYHEFFSEFERDAFKSNMERIQIFL